MYSCILEYPKINGDATRFLKLNFQLKHLIILFCFEDQEGELLEMLESDEPNLLERPLLEKSNESQPKEPFCTLKNPYILALSCLCLICITALERVAFKVMVDKMDSHSYLISFLFNLHHL